MLQLTHTPTRRQWVTFPVWPYMDAASSKAQLPGRQREVGIHEHEQERLTWRLADCRLIHPRAKTGFTDKNQKLLHTEAKCCHQLMLTHTLRYLVHDVLLLEKLLVLLQKLLVLLLDHQLLQGLGLSTLLLGQRSWLSSSQGAVAPCQLGDRGWRQWKAAQADCGKQTMCFNISVSMQERTLVLMSVCLWAE